MEKIRIGIFGLNRGCFNVKSILWNGGEIVAICDKNRRLRKDIEEITGHEIPFFEDFDEFIKTPMDCVLLTNYFHEHAPYAIRCLEMGINVISECTSNSTMAEGVALVRAAEKSKARYFLAENYPFMQSCCEMRRVYREGSLGKLMFAEGEYNHPRSPYYNTSDLSGLKYTISLFDNEKHWRNHLPATYYITHSLAPLMYMTGAFPKRVCAFATFMPEPADSDSYSYNGDKNAIIMTQNDDGSVYRITGCASFGTREDSYRICGTKGQMETMRDRSEKVMLNYNSWDTPKESEKSRCYFPGIFEKDKDSEYIMQTGHSGSDFVVIREIFDSIRNNTPFELDEYFATSMASVAILAHRSILYGGKHYDIPDFRLESDRKKWENDHQSPFYYSDGREPNIPCCSHPEYRPSKQQKENFEKWRRKYENGEFDDVDNIKG